VTGMSIVDADTHLRPFGYAVVGGLVQIGGLGFVTFAVVAAMSLGKKMALQYQAVALEAFNQTSVSKIHSTAFSVFKLTAAIELVGIIIFTAWWLPEKGFLDAL